MRCVNTPAESMATARSDKKLLILYLLRNKNDKRKELKGILKKCHHAELGYSVNRGGSFSWMNSANAFSSRQPGVNRC